MRRGCIYVPESARPSEAPRQPGRSRSRSSWDLKSPKCRSNFFFFFVVVVVVVVFASNPSKELVFLFLLFFLMIWLWPSHGCWRRWRKKMDHLQFRLTENVMVFSRRAFEHTTWSHVGSLRKRRVSGRGAPFCGRASLLTSPFLHSKRHSPSRSNHGRNHGWGA